VKDWDGKQNGMYRIFNTCNHQTRGQSKARQNRMYHGTLSPKIPPIEKEEGKSAAACMIKII
jgi:hypothetical protein